MPELSEDALRLRLELKIRDALRRGHKQYNISMTLVGDGSFVKRLLNNEREFRRTSLKKAYDRLHLIDKPIPLTKPTRRLLAS